MVASELRIGNLVNPTNDNVKRPYVITAQELLYFEADKRRFEPISLTEEWLLKFGFVYRNENRGLLAILDLTKEHWKLNLSGGFTKDGFHVMNCPTCVDLKYVHQLQNLYFTLTREELILK